MSRIVRNGPNNCIKCLECGREAPVGEERACGKKDCPFGVVDYDPVNHPKHYTQHPSGVECIQITRHMGFNLGNAMKYIWRADLKNGLEDLRKAVWYIEDELKKRSNPPERP